MQRSSILTFTIATATAVLLAAGTASAACKKMGFLVNDYGKDGPTKDAQELLEKDVAKWAAGQGIKTYTLTKKDVTCELFLNFIVFDEHTCTASATVCWDEKAPGGKPAAAQEAKATTGDDVKPAAKTTAEKPAAKPADENKPAIDAKASDSKPSESKPAKAAAAVETGTVNAPAAEAPAASTATAVTGQSAAATPEKDPSQAAAAAAERAAAAAERAAIAAERAAQAALDAQQQGASGASASAAATTPAAVAQPITPLPATP